MRTILFLLFGLLPSVVLAIETGIITDPDGFSHLRSGPSSSSKIVEKLISGEIVQIDAREGDWAKVKTVLGRTGYLHQTRISLIYQERKAKGNHEISEDGEAASRSGINYPLAVKYANAGRPSAIQLFFWMAQHGEFDGAAAEGLAIDLTGILKSVGDAKFAALLGKEPNETRFAVMEYLEFEIGPLDKFPATKQLKP